MGAKPLVFIFSTLMAAGVCYAGPGVDSQFQELNKKIDALTQTIQSLSTTVGQQQTRIESLERENAALKAQPPAIPPPAVSAPALGQTGGRTGQSFNPDIGVLIDVTAMLSESREDEEGNDKLSVRELELLIGHDIDPYGRFDSTITLSDFEDVDIEEAYITYWDLPWDLQLRLGRFRQKLGKQVSVHRDQLFTVDEPLVVANYFGPEGLFRTGVEFSRFLPTLSDKLTQELTAGVMEGGVGEDGSLFGETRRRPSFYVHLKNFFDISPNTSFELGGTYLRGSSDADANNEVGLFGVDATLKHKFETASREITLQSELYAQQRQETVLLTDDGSFRYFNDDPYGFYTLFNYKHSIRWEFGARYDYVQPVSLRLNGGGGADQAYSAYATFHQSEFVRLRAQYEHVQFASGGDDDRLMFQGTYIVGVHKHVIK
ncbi:MAG: hypothetical protein AAB353_03950 [Candidatus Hydrogenedentota bacterium]